MIKIHQRSEDLNNAFQQRHLLRCIKGGTETMRQAREKYLPRQKSEIAGFDKDLGKMHDPYEERLQRSNLINITSESVARMVSKIMRKPTTITAKYPKHQAKIDDMVDDIDGNGMRLHDLQVKALTEAIWHGSGGFLGDINDEGQVVAHFVHIDDVLQAFVDDESGELVFLRIREFRKTLDFDTLKEEVVKQEKVYKKQDGKVSWARYQQGDKDGERVLIDDWRETILDRIPFVAFKAGEALDGDPLICRSAVQNLAELSVRHWNKDSDLENIYHISCCPMLFGSGMGSKKDMNYTVSRMIMNSNPGADIKWIEPGGSAIKLAQESLDRLESKMESMGFSFVANGQQETATGRGLKANENNSTVGGIAKALQSSLEELFDVLLRMHLYGVEPDISVSVNQDFGVTISTDELNALTAAYTGGALSRHYYLRELMRRGVLDDEVDTEENTLHIQAERDMEGINSMG